MATEAQIDGLGQFANLGFTIEYDGATAFLLLHEGETVARFSQSGATKEGIQAECTRHLTLRHAEIECKE